jgi:hypothetical protein
MTELCAEPLVGFRSWRVDHRGVLLPAHGHDRRSPWAHDFASARCDRVPSAWPQCEDAPGRDCLCGLYAYNAVTPYGGGRVHGCVVAWGRIVEHDDGFRAQYARPVALLADESYDECERAMLFDTLSQLSRPTTSLDPAGTRPSALARAAERHGLPVLPLEELVAYAAWFGELRSSFSAA